MQDAEPLSSISGGVAVLKCLRRYFDETNPSLVDVAQVAGLLAERALVMRGP